MQVVCANCQLSFEAPEGASGLVCPICRSPLRPADGAAASPAAEARQIVDWSGGTLDDLIGLLSAPAWSARVEVVTPGGGTAGEVHVIAGGVSDAIVEGKSTYDALDKLRAIKGAQFKVEPRLPNPSDGDLTFPGPDQGKLEERPLATLMRYCEDYVLTASIEVWRGNENAKIEYRRGAIVPDGITVGGIDAPERLAEVMQWSSGNYRLVSPKLALPETAPKAPAPAAPPPRPSGAANKTIFGIPALDPATIAAAAEHVKASQAQAKAALAAAAAATAPPAAAAPATTRASATHAPPPEPAPAPPPPATPGTSRPSVAKTMFGVPAPTLPVTGSPATTAAPARAPTPTPDTAVEAPRGARTAAGDEPRAPAKTGRTRIPTPVTAIPAVTGEPERTHRTKVPKPQPTETPVWTYVGVGFVFGLALLGVYRLFVVLAH